MEHFQVNSTSSFILVLSLSVYAIRRQNSIQRESVLSFTHLNSRGKRITNLDS